METGARGITYRSVFGMAVVVMAAVVAAAILADAAIRGGWSVFGRALPWVLLVMWLLWVGLVASYVRVAREGVWVQNLLRRTHASWGAVDEIGARWQLRLALSDGRRIDCLAAPVRTRQRGRPTPVERDLESIRELWTQERGSAAIILRSWDIPMLLAGLIIIVWTLVATLLIPA